MKNSNTGFTLAEFAVGLVVVGLLLAGIVNGQEMVVQSRIKHAIADINGVSAAMYAYHDRYRALPGDDKGSGRWGLTPPASAGNGVIEGKYASNSATDESRLVWEHLRRAGFVAGSGSENPFNVVFGKIGVQTGDGSGVSPAGVLGTSDNADLFTGLIVCTANLPDKIAISVDAQLDDGKGKTGSVRANKTTDQANQGNGKGNAGWNPIVTKVADDYAEDGVTTYMVCRQTLL